MRCGVNGTSGSGIPIQVSYRQPNLTLVSVNTLVDKDVNGDMATCA